MPSPFDHVETAETGARRTIYGAAGSGLFGQLRQPRQVGERVLARAYSSRSVRVITESRWWVRVWDTARERLSGFLGAVAHRSGSAAWLELVARRIDPRTAQEEAALAAFEASRRRAERAIDELLAQQTGILDRGLWDAARQRLTSREAIAELAARIGPTDRQLERILAWQRRQELAGVPREEILAGLRRRTHHASMLRARAIASDQTGRALNDSRVAVFAEAGVLVYSANVGDDRVRDLHHEQTAATLAEPVLAGEPWRGVVPFAGNPPYEVFCRCWIEAAQVGPRSA